MTKYDGIKGLHGSDSIGACVTIGVKSDRGFPTNTDRWHVVSSKEENGVRNLHPAFVPFNTASVDKRKILRGNIIHAQQGQCFEYHLKAQVLKKAHPNKKPCCVGDGTMATRWMGNEPDNFSDIKCPHDLCEYRTKKPPMCKPWMRFLFRLRWENGEGLPTPLVKFTSGSWYTASNFKGFFEYLANTARELGLENYTLFGLPFIMTLQYQTKPSAGSRFPVVSISPESDPIEFFMAQRAKIKELTGEVPLAITDNSQQDDGVIFEDMKSISVPSEIPKETVVAEVVIPMTLEERLSSCDNFEELALIFAEVNKARKDKILEEGEYSDLVKIKNTKKKQFESEGK